MGSTESGLSLDEHFDLDLENGDAGSTEGLDEIAKDCAFRVRRIVDRRYAGDVLRGNRKTKLESRIRSGLVDDPRVFDAEVVARGNPSTNSIEIAILVVSTLGMFEDTISP